jgi:PmbA protein
MSCSVIGGTGDNMQRDDWWTVARDAADMESAESVGRKAAERTVRRLGGQSLSTRHCPVIFAAEVAGGLIGHFIGAIRGGNLYRKSSFLLDQLGKPVFPGFIHIHEQPHLRKALGSAPYDGEGVATHAHDIVKDGILQSYVLSTYSARKLGMKTTGNAGGVHNLILDPGDLDLPGLVGKMGTGLLVTELMGQGVNIVTGDYSRGAGGFWVENGEIQYPVEEFTIAGNLKDMLMNIVAVGNDVDLRGNTRTGSLLLGEMTVAGN